MSSAIDLIVFSFATILGVATVGLIVVWFIQDVTQKKHSVLRNYPVIGRLRYFFEVQGKYFRQYFFANDRDEMPFNRATRAWIYKNSKNKGSIVGFGSTNDLRQPGSIIFVNAAFPIQEEDQLPTPSLRIGQGYCEHPFEAKSIINISAMSYGSLSKNAILALNAGAKQGGFYHNTGEGGLSPYHLGPGGDVVWNIGTGYFSTRTPDGKFSVEEFTKRATLDNVKMIEIKFSQGAKPGHGGIGKGFCAARHPERLRKRRRGRDQRAAADAERESRQRQLRVLRFARHVA